MPGQLNEHIFPVAFLRDRLILSLFWLINCSFGPSYAASVIDEGFVSLLKACSTRRNFAFRAVSESMLSDGEASYVCSSIFEPCVETV